ncbi:hypothetical protein LX36DRAFT_223399 [Colletotrichum falcatum]|nr:hypothetical protein LX36DRAFT_223399 [Colletotrichum falcatum]
MRLDDSCFAPPRHSVSSQRTNASYRKYCRSLRGGQRHPAKLADQLSLRTSETCTKDAPLFAAYECHGIASGNTWLGDEDRKGFDPTGILRAMAHLQPLLCHAGSLAILTKTMATDRPASLSRGGRQSWFRVHVPARPRVLQGILAATLVLNAIPQATRRTACLATWSPFQWTTDRFCKTMGQSLPIQTLEGIGAGRQEGDVRNSHPYLWTSCPPDLS